MLHSLIGIDEQLCDRVKAITTLDDDGKKCYDLLLRDDVQQRLRSNLLSAMVSADSAGDVGSELAYRDAGPKFSRMSLPVDGQ